MFFLFSLTNLYFVNADGIEYNLLSSTSVGEFFEQWNLNSRINSERIGIYEIAIKTLLAEKNITTLNWAQGSNVYCLL